MRTSWKHKTNDRSSSGGWGTGAQSSGWGTSAQNSGWGTGAQSSGWGTSAQNSGWGTSAQSSGWGTGAQSSGWGTGSFGQNSGFAAKPPTKVCFDRTGLILTLLSAVIGVFLGNALYASSLSDVLRMGLLVLTVCGLPLCCFFLYTLLRSARYTHRRAAIAVLAAALALLFGSSCLLQFLYGLGGCVEVLPIDDYVFIIDDSGSMTENDPLNERIEALNRVLSGLDATSRTALVCFTGHITAELEMETMTSAHRASIAQIASTMQSSGDTDISNALNYVLNGRGAVRLDPDRTSMIVLLTDGHGGHVSVQSIARKCSAQNAVLSTIGLGSAVNEEQLRALAEATGGRYYPVSSAEFLEHIYNQVNIVDQSRNLLGFRGGKAHSSVWLGVLRIFSWLVFGLLTGLAAAWMLQGSPMPMLRLGAGIAAGLLIGLILELLNSLWCNALPLRFALLLTLSLIPLFYEKPIPTDSGFISWKSGNAGHGTAGDPSTASIFAQTPPADSSSKVFK